MEVTSGGHAADGEGMVGEYLDSDQGLLLWGQWRSSAGALGGSGAGIVTMSAAARGGGDRLLVHSSRRGIGELAMIAAAGAVAIVCRCAGR